MKIVKITVITLVILWVIGSVISSISDIFTHFKGTSNQPHESLGNPKSSTGLIKDKPASTANNKLVSQQDETELAHTPVSLKKSARSAGDKLANNVSSKAVPQQIETPYISTVKLNVRARPSLRGPILGVIKQGEAISVQSRLSNGWYRIRYYGKNGYVSGQFVTTKNSAFVYKMNVPVVLQNPELPTGCEVTSLTMALNYKGVKIDKVTLAKKMPYTTTFNPDKGFVGSPFKKTGETINPVKLQELAKIYRSKSMDLTGASINSIEQEVRVGNPVLVWFTIGYVIPRNEYLYKNGQRYWFPQPLHCIVVTGVSIASFFINDPLNGNKNYEIEKEQFNKIYTKMGKRALVVR